MSRPDHVVLPGRTAWNQALRAAQEVLALEEEQGDSAWCTPAELCACIHPPPEPGFGESRGDWIALRERLAARLLELHWSALQLQRICHFDRQTTRRLKAALGADAVRWANP